LNRRFNWTRVICTCLFVGCLFTGPAWAMEITDTFSIGGVLAGAYQHQEVNNVTEPNDSIGRGALPFQPELHWTPTKKDEVFAKFGFAAGDGLNDPDVAVFNLAPWAADLESDLKNLNGTGRDYLLTAWYKHTFEFESGHNIGLTGGIIDATDYLDQNAYSNDEYTQFMNAALVNGPNAFLPSYDIGGAIEYQYKERFSLNAVVMNVGQTDATTGENNFNFYGAQFGYRVQTGMGQGTYRVLVNYGSEDFLDPTGTQRESKMSYFLSFDQELGKNFGVWIRFGGQTDDAAITYENIYSGGVQINGTIYGRDADTIGIGYAYLPGANQIGNSIDSSQVAEIYWKFGLNDYVSVTADAQYMADDYVPAAGDGPDGYILGVRATVEF